MANHRSVCVKATGVVPSGRVILSGKPNDVALGKRVTRNPISTRNPTIITNVSVVTRIRKNRKVLGSLSGVSFMSSSPILVTIAADPPSRLDKALARDVPAEAHLSRTQISRLISAGAVSRDGLAVSDPKLKVAEGDVFVILAPEAVETHMVAEAIELDIVFEDDDLVVINKPAGMVVHPAPGSPSGTLVNALLHHCGDSLSGIGGEKRPGIVHRIDKDTSGLLVVAKSDVAHQGLAAQFEAHTVERAYFALVYGVPDAGDPRLRGVKGVSFEDGGALKISTQLARHKTDRQRQAVTFSGGRHAITRARVTERFGTDFAVVECRLETGRTHQIRVHMAHVGHGLVGDPVYGGRRKLSEKRLGSAIVTTVQMFQRQALHAVILGFEHPVTGNFLRFNADLPDDLAELIRILGDSPNDTSA